MRLLTWNVRYCAHALRGLGSTQRGLERIAAALASSGADVIALQEVEDRSLRGGLRRSQAARLLDALHGAGPLHWRAWRAPAHHYSVAGIPLMSPGLLWLAREELSVSEPVVEEITHVRLPVAEALKQGRVASLLRVHTAEGPLDLVNTHLSLPAFLEVGPHRLPERMGDGSNQLAEMNNLLSFIERTGGPHVVIAGDLNSRPGSPAHARLAAAGFDDPWLGHDTPTAGFGRRRMHIDHIVGRGVVWADPTLHTVDVAGAFTGLSDHVPKAVTVVARGE